MYIQLRQSVHRAYAQTGLNRSFNKFKIW